MNKSYLQSRRAIIKVLFYTVWLSPFSVLAQITPFQYDVNKKAEGVNGAVVSAHPLATQAGLQIL